jgi:5-(carboxyamino)imidazole ribonucleotide synthase
LEISQDRLTEKTFLNQIGVETARFWPVDSGANLRAGLAEFGGEGVLKTRRFGYDGKGQRVLRTSDADDDGIVASMGGGDLILEELVPFEREISIIAARTLDGSVLAYDPAENVHREGILRSSAVPADISATCAEKAAAYAAALLVELDYVGVLGLEFFVAPRRQAAGQRVCAPGSQFWSLDGSGLPHLAV